MKFLDGRRLVVLWTLLISWSARYSHALLTSSRTLIGQGFHRILETTLSMANSSSFPSSEIFTFLMFESLGKECYADLDHLKRTMNESGPNVTHAWFVDSRPEIELPASTAPIQRMVIAGHSQLPVDLASSNETLVLKIPLHLRYPRLCPLSSNQESSEQYVSCPANLRFPRIYIHIGHHILLNDIVSSVTSQHFPGTETELHSPAHDILLKGYLFQPVPSSTVVSNSDEVFQMDCHETRSDVSIPRGNKEDFPWLGRILHLVVWSSSLCLIVLMILFRS
jgi:hypothetical protein